MTEGQVLEFTRVTKRFNEVTAVSDFSARIEPGAVTAFLGPNGAGKTTTLRMLLGQLRPSSGTATIGGAAYGDLRQPLRTIGSVLEETVYRPRRTANRQLTIAAKANDIPLSRVDEVLALVGLENDGESRIGGFSLGMRQRLSIAHALLGDPGALVFDEPANGLDPEGIRWMRLLMRRLADEGRTVLVSSHVLSEVEQVADNVLVLSKGQLVLASGMEELADPSAGAVIVDADDRSALTAALATAGFDIEILRSGLTVRGSDARRVGEVAADAGIALTTLVQRGPTLEDVFIQLTRGGKREPHAALAATNLVAPRPASEAAPVAAPVFAAPVDAAPVASEPVAETVDAEAAAASAITADIAGAVPGGPVAAAVVAAGAGTAIAHDDADASDSDAADVDAADADAADADTASAVDDASETNVVADSSDTAPVPIVAPAPSFDDILFGAAPVEETPSAFPAADASADEAPAPDASPSADERPVENDDHARHDGARTEEAHAKEVHAEASDEASEDDASDDIAGVEVFDALAATGTIDAMPHEGSFEDAAHGDASAESAPEGDDEDPRAAAVSSMLADAARTYFDDEPKDYPFGSPAAEAPAEHIDSEHIEVSPADVSLDGEDVQTHVIEIIDATPLSASDDDAANADEHDAENHEHHEHHDGDDHEHHHHG